MTIIMNEYGQVIWWGALKSSESIMEIQPDLERLKLRLDKVNSDEKLRVIYNNKLIDY
jgi:hypothetical protein